MNPPLENGILSLRLSDDLAVRVVRAAEYREKPVDRWAVGCREWGQSKILDRILILANRATASNGPSINS